MNQLINFVKKNLMGMAIGAGLYYAYLKYKAKQAASA